MELYKHCLIHGLILRFDTRWQSCNIKTLFALSYSSTSNILSDEAKNIKKYTFFYSPIFSCLDRLSIELQDTLVNVLETFSYILKCIVLKCCDQVKKPYTDMSRGWQVLTALTRFSRSSNFCSASRSLRTPSKRLISSAANFSGSTWISFGMWYVRWRGTKKNDAVWTFYVNTQTLGLLMKAKNI